MIDYNKEIDRLYKKAFPNEYAKQKELEREALRLKPIIEKNRGKGKLPIDIFNLLDDAFDY